MKNYFNSVIIRALPALLVAWLLTCDLAAKRFPSSVSPEVVKKILMLERQIGLGRYVDGALKLDVSPAEGMEILAAAAVDPDLQTQVLSVLLELVRDADVPASHFHTLDSAILIADTASQDVRELGARLQWILAFLRSKDEVRVRMVKDLLWSRKASDWLLVHDVIALISYRGGKIYEDLLKSRLAETRINSHLERQIKRALERIKLKNRLLELDTAERVNATYELVLVYGSSDSGRSAVAFLVAEMQRMSSAEALALMKRLEDDPRLHSSARTIVKRALGLSAARH